MVTQTNVLSQVTKNVIQGLANARQFGGLQLAPGTTQASLTTNWPVIQLADGEMLRNNMSPRAPGAGFKRLDAKITLDTSTVTGDGFEILIDKSIAEDSTKSGLDILSVYSRELMLNAFRMHEAEVAALAQGSDFSATAPTEDYTAANITQMDVPQDIQAAIDAIAGRGEMANTIVIPVVVWNRIRFSDKLSAFIAGSVNPGASVTPANIAASFADEGIQRVIIGRPRVNTAAKGAESISPIWANTHLWVGAAEGASVEGDGNSFGTAMATFYREEQAAPFQIETYYSDERRSHVLRVFGETNTKTVNARAGQRITTNYS